MPLFIFLLNLIQRRMQVRGFSLMNVACTTVFLDFYIRCVQANGIASYLCCQLITRPLSGVLVHDDDDTIATVSTCPACPTRYG